ncbi:MAG: hypothetical protein ABI700_04810 [Chloroflexota bacterium]
MRKFVIVGFYALIAFLALYNPIFHITTNLPNDPHLAVVTDFYHFHWNFWWIRHALTTPGLNVYLTNYVMAPFTSNLAYHTLSVFWYPIWALLEPTFGTVVGMTAVFIAALVLAAVSFYALLRDEGVSPGLALIGGLILEISPLMLASIEWTNINLMGWFWVPVLLLTWKQIVGAAQRHGRRLIAWAVMLGLSLWAMVLTDLQYPLFAFFIVVPYGLMTLWRAHSWQIRRWLVVALALALVIALLLLWFVGPLPYILAFDRSDLAPTPADRAPAIHFPVSYVWHCDTGLPIGAIVLPTLVIALAISLRKRVRWTDARWFWLALVPVPLLLSAGASITLGSTAITMPYIWLHNLFGGEFRYPERFSVVFLIPAVIFSAITFSSVLRRPRTLRIFVLAALCFLVIADGHMLEPTPLQPIPYPYSFYQAMGKEPYDYVVVEVPTGGASGEGLVGESRFLVTQYYGITHGKRMVNGHISRVPISHYWYMRTDDPMMAWLGQRRFVEPEVVEQQMKQRISEWPIGYFVIHRDWIGGVGSVTDQEILGYFNSLRDLVCPVWIEGDAIVYRTTWHPDGCPARIPPQDASGSYVIDIGSTDDLHYIGWGWHQPEDISGLTLRWTGEYPQTEVYLDLPSGGYALTISAQAFYEPRRLRLLINDQQVGDPVTVTPASLRPYTFPIPADVIGDGQHLKLTLDYDATVVPTLVGQGSDARKLAVAFDTIAFAPEQ